MSVLGFIFLVPVLVEAHPKDFTVLIEDPADSSPSGDRTPLVLIHGIHGNQWPTDVDDVNNPFLYYWVLSIFLCEFIIGQFFEEWQVVIHFSYWV